MVRTPNEATTWGQFTMPFSITGQPAGSLTLRWTLDGLAVGVQLIADHGLKANSCVSPRAWSTRATVGSPPAPNVFEIGGNLGGCPKPRAYPARMLKSLIADGRS